MDNPLVSIIVPVYNVENYLIECFESLVHQTYQNTEIILIDDGSTDSSGDLCDSIALKDDRIIVIHKRNEGLSSARNEGLKISSGEYITFVDSDDYIEQDMIECMVELAVRENIPLVSCGITANSELLHQGVTSKFEVLNSAEALKCIFAESKMTTSASGKLYKAELWERLRFPAGKIYEDYATIYKILLNTERIILIAENKYYYRPNPTGITGANFSVKRMQYFEVTKDVMQDIENTYPFLAIYVRNRTTRYAISFYRDIAKSNFDDAMIVSQLHDIVKAGIRSYLLSGYSILSKMYGVLITCFPSAALKIFKKDR